MNESHAQHERRFRGGPERLRAAERVALLEVDRVVTASLEDLSVVSMLDVGTGTGVFAEAFAGLIPEVTAVDTNAELLKVAREHVPDARFRQAAAEALPFEDAAFDLVFLGHVLHETDDPVKTLEEARRVARRRVVVLEWPYREEEQGPPLAHRLQPEAIAASARSAGYRDLEQVPLAHMVLYRLTP